jgi:hypothetical protein
MGKFQGSLKEPAANGNPSIVARNFFRSALFSSG